MRTCEIHANHWQYLNLNQGSTFCVDTKPVRAKCEHLATKCVDSAFWDVILQQAKLLSQGC